MASQHTVGAITLMEVVQMLCFQAITVYCELVLSIRRKKLYLVITLLLLLSWSFFQWPHVGLYLGS